MSPGDMSNALGRVSQTWTERCVAVTKRCASILCEGGEHGARWFDGFVEEKNQKIHQQKF